MVGCDGFGPGRPQNMSAIVSFCLTKESPAVVRMQEQLQDFSRSQASMWAVEPLRHDVEFHHPRELFVNCAFPMEWLNYHHLHSFCTVALTGSISKASKEL